jgi:hypothetical protein
MASPFWRGLNPVGEVFGQGLEALGTQEIDEILVREERLEALHHHERRCCACSAFSTMQRWRATSFW